MYSVWRTYSLLWLYSRGQAQGNRFWGCVGDGRLAYFIASSGNTPVCRPVVCEQTKFANSEQNSRIMPKKQLVASDQNASWCVYYFKKTQFNQVQRGSYAIFKKLRAEVEECNSINKCVFHSCLQRKHLCTCVQSEGTAPATVRRRRSWSGTRPGVDSQHQHLVNRVRRCAAPLRNLAYLYGEL